MFGFADRTTRKPPTVNPKFTVLGINADGTLSVQEGAPDRPERARRQPKALNRELLKAYCRWDDETLDLAMQQPDFPSGKRTDSSSWFNVFHDRPSQDVSRVLWKKENGVTSC